MKIPNPLKFFSTSKKSIKLSSKKMFHAGTELAEGEDSGTSGVTYSGKSKKETEAAVSRVDQKELERMYSTDPVIFNGVNMYMRSVLNGYEITAEDEEVTAFFKEFTDNVSFDLIMSQVIQHICIYGNAWVELIKSKGGGDIVDLDIIDPKTMDIIRDDQERVKLDAKGKIEGYVQNKNTADEILFKPDEIAHFKLFTIADAFLGIGLIEPLYKIALIKMNIQEGIGQSIYRHGFPIVVAYLGDEKHEPNPEDYQKFGEILRRMNYLSELAVPYYYKVTILEGKNVEKLKAHMDFFVDQEVAGLGVPKALVLGMGEKTNRATLDVQDRVWVRSLKTMQKVLAYNIERKIFQAICDANNFEECPKIVWDELTTENLDSKAERLNLLGKQGFITPDLATEEVLRKTENLPSKEGGEIPVEDPTKSPVEEPEKEPEIKPEPKEEPEVKPENQK